MSITSPLPEGIPNDVFLVPRVPGSIQTSPYSSEHLFCLTSGGLPSLSSSFLSGNRYTDGLQSSLDFACMSSVACLRIHMLISIPGYPLGSHLFSSASLVRSGAGSHGKSLSSLVLRLALRGLSCLPLATHRTSTGDSSSLDSSSALLEPC